MNEEVSIDQTVAGAVGSSVFNLDLQVSKQERETLRDLATRVRALSESPAEAEKKELWTKHNDLEQARPLIFCDPENGWNEIVAQKDLLCENPLLRLWEMHLRKELFWGEEMKDDRVIERFFDVAYSYEDSQWGLIETIIQTDKERGSFVWNAPIEDYEKDFSKLSYPTITINTKQTDKTMALAGDLFGDILWVRLRNPWWWSLGMTWDFIRLRGLEKLMTDMIDQPSNVHRLMGFLKEGTMKKLDFLEEEGLLSSNTGGAYVGSGGFGWTNQLPDGSTAEGGARTIDMWGFAESQETVGVSPEMFAEFILPYQIPILDRFGLNCYGCCEPLDKRWHLVKEIPRLRRVSVSPWSNPELMREYLGCDYIMSLKPAPSQLALPQLDENLVRKNLRNDLRATKGGIVELIMKDNHTLGGNPRNATRWVELAREEIGSL